MRIYLVGSKFGKPAFVFDSYKKAEEVIIQKIRETHPCGFSFSINMRYLNQIGETYAYYYTGKIEDAGNLRFIEFKDHKKEVRREVVVKYHGTEWEIINTQIEDVSPSNPHYIYFNTISNIDTFAWNIKKKGLIYKKEWIEKVTHEWIRDYFKYKIYLSSYDTFTE